MIDSWEKSRLSLLLTELAKSKSIAANFDEKKWSGLIPIDADELGPHNLNEIQTATINDVAVRRKTLQARFDSFTAVPPPRSASASQCSSSTSSMSSSSDEENEVERQASPQSYVTVSEGEGKPKAVKIAIDTDNGMANESTPRQQAGEPGNNKDDDKPKPEKDDRAVVVASPVPSEPTSVIPRGPVHEGIHCDGCKMENIVGVRWKCLQCTDYDLCDKCHSTGAHEHEDFLKIEHPDDYKIWQFVVSPPHQFLYLF